MHTQHRTDCARLRARNLPREALSKDSKLVRYSLHIAQHFQRSSNSGPPPHHSRAVSLPRPRRDFPTSPDLFDTPRGPTVPGGSQESGVHTTRHFAPSPLSICDAKPSRNQSALFPHLHDRPLASAIRLLLGNDPDLVPSINLFYFSVTKGWPSSFQIDTGCFPGCFPPRHEKLRRRALAKSNQTRASLPLFDPGAHRILRFITLSEGHTTYAQPWVISCALTRRYSASTSHCQKE